MFDDDDALRSRIAELQAHADLGLEPNGEDAMVGRLRERLASGVPAQPIHRRGLLRPSRAGVLASLTGLLVAGGVATAATGVWNPPLGDSNRGHPTASSTDVPADQLQRFGVLRRLATAADRDAATLKSLSYLNARFEGVRTDRIRAPEGLPADQYLIVPIQRWTATGITDALCLFATDNDGGGTGCWNTTQILAGKAIMLALSPSHTDGSAISAGRGTLIGLVPDGVTAISAGVGQARVAVHDNVFVAPITGNAGAPPNPTWFDADGNEVPFTM